MANEVIAAIIGALVTAICGATGYLIKSSVGKVKVSFNYYENWGEKILDIGLTNTKKNPVIISKLKLQYEGKQGVCEEEIYDMGTKESNNIMSTIDKTSSYELQPMEAKVVKCLTKSGIVHGRKMYLSYEENGKHRKKYAYTQIMEVK